MVSHAPNTCTRTGEQPPPPPGMASETNHGVLTRVCVKEKPEITEAALTPLDSGKGPEKRSTVRRSTSRVCNELGIVWVKLGKHPYWPARIVGSEMAGDERYENSLAYKRDVDDTCVLFFGTHNVAWIRRAKNNVFPWKYGIQKGRLWHTKLRSRKSYQGALRDVRLLVRDYQ